MTQPRTSPALLARLAQAAKHVMTPEERRQQRLSFIAGQTGYSRDLIVSVLPELAP